MPLQSQGCTENLIAQDGIICLTEGELSVMKMEDVSTKLQNVGTKKASVPTMNNASSAIITLKATSIPVNIKRTNVQTRIAETRDIVHSIIQYMKRKNGKLLSKIISKMRMMIMIMMRCSISKVMKMIHLMFLTMTHPSFLTLMLQELHMMAIRIRLPIITMVMSMVVQECHVLGANIIIILLLTSNQNLRLNTSAI